MLKFISRHLKLMTSLSVYQLVGWLQDLGRRARGLVTHHTAAREPQPHLCCSLLQSASICRGLQQSITSRERENKEILLSGYYGDIKYKIVKEADSGKGECFLSRNGFSCAQSQEAQAGGWTTDLSS